MAGESGYSEQAPIKHISITQTLPSDNACLHNAAMIICTAYRKVDIRLLAWYSFVYFFMRIESHNITNAAIMNVEVGTDIQRQLGNLTSEQWALVLSIYYYPYLFLEPASTLLLKKCGPRKWMSRIMISWGVVAMCHGAARNFSGILACRFFLGLTEAGFAPGVLYHLSLWYPTERLPLRIVIFYAFGQLAGVASGLMAFAVSYLDSKADLAGWRWLFILEGIPAVLCGLISFFTLPNYPEQASFLSEPQRDSIKSELPSTQARAEDKTWDCVQARSLFRDPTSYTFCMIWSCHAIGAKGVHILLPTIIFELGLANTAKSQLMTMPPYVVGAAGLVLIAWLIRQKLLNCWVTACCLEGIGCICYIVLVTVENPVVRYIFVNLAAASSIGLTPILWPERIRATNGTTSSALAIGMTAASAQLAGIVGPQVYQEKFGPRFTTSFTVSLTLLVVVMLSVAATRLLLSRRETKVLQVREDEVPHGKTSLAMSSMAKPDPRIARTFTCSMAQERRPSEVRGPMRRD